VTTSRVDLSAKLSRREQRSDNAARLGGQAWPNTQGCVEVRSRCCTGARSRLGRRGGGLHRRSITCGRDRHCHGAHGQSEKPGRDARGDRRRHPGALHDAAEDSVHVLVGHDSRCERKPQRSGAAPVDVWHGHRHEDQAGHRPEPGSRAATTTSNAATAGTSAAGSNSTTTATAAAGADSTTAGASAASIVGTARAGVPVHAFPGWKRLGLWGRLRHRALSGAATNFGPVGDDAITLVGGFRDRA